MKRKIVLWPVFVMALGFLCPGAVYGAAESLTPGGDGRYYIHTAEELASICVDDSSRQYVLGADINIPPGWVPIGIDVLGRAVGFKGSLDGRGHSVIGLDIDATVGDMVGLFGKLEGASVSNIVLVDAGIHIGGDFGGREFAAGLLAGEAADCAISNITITGGNIAVTGTGLASAAIGGLIGKGTGTRLGDICVTVQINDSRNRWPAMGRGAGNPGRDVPGAVEQDSLKAVGGMAGKLNNCMVERSLANVQIYANAETIGGVVGLATDTGFHGSGTGEGVVSQFCMECTQEPALKPSRNRRISFRDGTAATNEKSAVGGFAGRLEGMATVQECYSHANVAGDIAGGFAGQLLGRRLPGNANHVLEVAKCTATGETTSAIDGIAGGFAGIVEYALIKDSSAYGDVKGCGHAGGFVGRLSGLSRVIYAYAMGDVFLEISCNGSAAQSVTADGGNRNVAPPVTAGNGGQRMTQPATAADGGQQAPQPAYLSGFAGGFVGELTGSACVEFSYSTGAVATREGAEGAVGGFVGGISAVGTPNTITHCLSFAPWVVGEGYVHRFAGRADHDGVNGCYAYLGSMVVRDGNIAHVLPNAFGPDGADMSRAQVEDVAKRLGWRRPMPPPYAATDDSG
ncbi:MAG: hypothetical protein FWC77_05935 [Defluviitaleaceae bacterium]|nr:hypothetical protein [Defluviitaleaceae bacterium]